MDMDITADVLEVKKLLTDVGIFLKVSEKTCPRGFHSWNA